MTDPLEFCSTCPACVGKRRADEAAAGLRCATCLTSFEKPYPVESAEHKGFCNPCGSVLHTRRPNAGRYGTSEPYREPWEAPASTQANENSSGVRSTAKTGETA